jgi:hypothetical protein
LVAIIFVGKEKCVSCDENALEYSLLDESSSEEEDSSVSQDSFSDQEPSVNEDYSSEVENPFVSQDFIFGQEFFVLEGSSSEEELSDNEKASPDPATKS